MRDAIAVINAGSSSIKFAVFAFDEESSRLQRMFVGSIRDLGTASPRFIVKNAAGDVLESKQWEEGARLGYEDAIAFLLESLPRHLKGQRLRAVGHRVVHGGYQPSQVETEAAITSIEGLEQFVLERLVAKRNEYGSASAVWNVGFDAGMGIGSVLVGGIAAGYSFPVALMVAAAISLATLPLAIVRAKKAH